MQCPVCRAKERCGLRKFGSPCTMDSAWDLDPIWWMVSKLLGQSIKQWDHYYYCTYYTYVILHYYFDIIIIIYIYYINHDGSQTYLDAFLKRPNSRINRLDLSPGKGEVCSRPQKWMGVAMADNCKKEKSPCLAQSMVIFYSTLW